MKPIPDLEQFQSLITGSSRFLLGREGRFMACCEVDTLLAGLVVLIFSVFQKCQCCGHNPGTGFINYLGSLSKWTQADLYGVDEIHSNSRKGRQIRWSVYSKEMKSNTGSKR